jgi:hypothetical protein
LKSVPRPIGPGLPLIAAAARARAGREALRARELAPHGLMQRREAGINDVRVAESDRRIAQSEVALCQDK